MNGRISTLSQPRARPLFRPLSSDRNRKELLNRQIVHCPDVRNLSGELAGRHVHRIFGNGVLPVPVWIDDVLSTRRNSNIDDTVQNAQTFRAFFHTGGKLSPGNFRVQSDDWAAML